MSRKSGSGSKKTDADLSSPRITRAEMRRGVMGKYARTTGSGSRFVELDQDIARRFQDTREVNETLRIVLKLRELGHGKRRKSA